MKENLVTDYKPAFVSTEAVSQKFVVRETPKDLKPSDNSHPEKPVTAPVFEGVPTLGV